MIGSIIDALDPEDIDFLRNTTFGNIISTCGPLVLIYSDSESDSGGYDSQAVEEQEQEVILPHQKGDVCSLMWKFK